VNRLVRDFVTDVVATMELPDPIVEFGAMQVEHDQDSDLRGLFPGRPYTGTDLRSGPGVDRIEDLRALSLADGSVGTAICVETLEHCADPVTACRELARVVAEPGVLIMSAPMLLGIHAYPDDYFRFTPAAVREMLAAFEHVSVAGVGDPAMPHWVLGLATRGRPPALAVDRLPSVLAAQRRFDRAFGGFRVGPLLIDPRELTATVLRQLPRVLADRVGRRSRRGGD
jgi:SAM-dependent methyltransferase